MLSLELIILRAKRFFWVFYPVAMKKMKILCLVGAVTAPSPRPTLDTVISIQHDSSISSNFFTQAVINAQMNTHGGPSEELSRVLSLCNSSFQCISGTAFLSFSACSVPPPAIGFHWVHLAPGSCDVALKPQGNFFKRFLTS
jgi:hypothetical protein